LLNNKLSGLLFSGQNVRQATVWVF